MWFGVAPVPAPSPRTNTKSWHPPHCTCPHHGGSVNAVGKSEAAVAHSPRTARSTTRRSVSPVRGERSTGRKQDSGSPTRKTSHTVAATAHSQKRNTHDDKPSVVDTLRSIADDATQRVHRLSRRLSNRPSAQSDCVDPSSKGSQEDRPEREEFFCREGDNNEAIIDSAPSVTVSRSRSRSGTAAGSTRPASGVRPALHPLDLLDSAPSPTSYLSIPAPTKSRRGSRGSQLRTGEEYTCARGTTATTLIKKKDVTTETCIHLSSPMSERAQPTNLVGHTSSVAVVLVDDARFLVSCSIDGSVKIWSRPTFECLYTLYGHRDAVSSVDLSSQWLVSGSHDTTLRVYESSHGFRFLHTLDGHSGHVTRVMLLNACSDQQQLALSCADDASLRLWDIAQGYCVAVFKAHASRVTCLLVLTTTLFCSGSADASVCFWDLAGATNSPQRVSNDAPSLHSSRKSFRVHKATVQSLLSVATETVFSCSNDGTIQWFDTRTLQHLGCVDAVQSPVYSMALHPTLGFLVCSTGDGRLLVYSNFTTTSGTLAKRELQVAPKWISSLQLLRGQLLACVSDDELYIVNLERPRIDRVVTTAHGFLNCVRWLQPEHLVTSGEDNIVKIWSLY